MKYFSTRNKNLAYSFGDAVTVGLAPDGGLFLPEFFPTPVTSISELSKLSRIDRISRVLYPFVSEDFGETNFHALIEKVFNFPCPVVNLSPDFSILELFHGPTLAFKDFGARFLANVLGSLPQAKQRQCVILVATSGDTGSAVAHAFSEVPGIKTIILYPSGKVSPIQEKQLTTFEKNITAYEVAGTFDDCQKLVKTAFMDNGLTSQYFLSSANSINIARLLPQAMYYMEAAYDASLIEKKLTFVTPSGNLGNVTAGLFVKNILRADWRFVAALNSNNVFEEFLMSGVYSPRPSVETYSNAMDVGNPSNLERIRYLYPTVTEIQQHIDVSHCTDEQTLSAMQEIFQRYQYIADPHTAVGFHAAQNQYATTPDRHFLVLSTAHPVKFDSVITKALGSAPSVPERLAGILKREKRSILIEPDYQMFKESLLKTLG